MEKDIRFPIGLFFAILGLVLTVYGLSTLHDQDLYARSMGVNLNLWTGLLMIVFSIAMLAGRKKRKT